MKRILLIEDNKDIRENTAEILELENYMVTTAENGEIGIQKALQYIPDIILCDIMMPKLDGYGVFEALKKSPRTASIPFIYLTSKSEKSDMRKGMELGADDYLTKPFEENELLNAIECRLKKNDFLRKEFSKNIDGINEFFNDASEYLKLEELSKDHELQKFKSKDDIFTEGSAAHQLYFIESGTIKTYRTTETGKELVTGLFGAGEFIGQLSLLNPKGIYVESAQAIENAKVYGISKKDFTNLLYRNREVSKKFISIISNDLIGTQEHLVDMAFATVRQKTAKALLELYHKGMIKDDANQGINIPREDFAGLIGTATETAIRMLTKFKNEGLIGVEPSRKIVLLNKKKLRHIADYSY